MGATTLNCLMCGAPAKSDATKCSHCGARLATVACPSCFGMVFEGSRFCQHCGSRVFRPVGKVTEMSCPGCESQLEEIALGNINVAECPKCDGLWVENAKFEEICANREQQSVILGAAGEIPKAELPMNVRYLKCPVCRGLMHRMNFANCSGVVIDTCKRHGTFFEKHELQRIIAFIRAGGMDKARERKKAEMEAAARRLEAARNADALQPRSYGRIESHADGYDAVSAVAWAIFKMLKK